MKSIWNISKKRKTSSNKENTKKVFVGLSGGVDSSVSAALLIDQGYDVVGVFMKTWQPDFVECTWVAERRDAMRVAAKLNIPFLTFDLEDAYKNGVADYMINEYKKGRTPNPDAMCNKEVKFGAFYKEARRLGADYIATGHYAQAVFNQESGLVDLYRGLDDSKDQSYFLWNVPQEALSGTLFPVGGLAKTEVRRLAKHYNLPTAVKKDSQGLCFIGPLDMKDFLRHYIDEKEGDVVSSDGRVIGRHRGVLFFTLGERHGFTIFDKGEESSPLYVIAKDLKHNILTVSSKEQNKSEILNKQKKIDLTLSEVNWLSSVQEITSEDWSLEVQYRYHGAFLPARIKSISEDSNGNIKTIMEIANIEEPLSAGQSLVIFKNRQCLGGGNIEV